MACLFLLPSEKVLILGIFRRGVMAGVLALMMLNRLQMLKERRGQECKRTDRQREKERERTGRKKQARDAAGPPGPHRVCD